MMLKPALRPPLRAPMRGATTLREGGGDIAGPVSRPAALPAYNGYAVVITRVGSGTASTFTTNYSYSASKPAANGTIYVGPDGNNANDGLTWANRVRSLSTAITKANALAVAVVAIKCKPGDYWRYSGSTLNDHFNGVIQTCDLIIEPDNVNGGAGDVYSWGNHAAAITWVQVGATQVYSSITLGNASPEKVFVDRTHLDAAGDPISLYQVTSVANAADPSPELIAAAAAFGRGAVFYDATPNPDKAWVVLFDNRAPDANFITLTPAAINFKVDATAKRRIWMKGIHFLGGDIPCNIIASDTFLHEVHASQCAFLASDGNSGGCFSWSGGGGFAVMDRCRASDGELDGFNYHGGTTTSPSILEIACTGDRNGKSAVGSANNTSTVHDAVQIISVNCVFSQSQDRTVHDVGSASRWMLGGSIAAPERTTTANGLVRAGNISDGGDSKIYLDTVTLGAISGSQYHLCAFDDQSQVRVHNMTLASLTVDPLGLGTVGTY